MLYSVYSFLIFNSNLANAITVRIDQPKVRLTVPAGGNKSGVINIENPPCQGVGSDLV